jgi:hypothetical protein
MIRTDRMSDHRRDQLRRYGIATQDCHTAHINLPAAHVLGFLL